MSLLYIIETHARAFATHVYARFWVWREVRRERQLRQQQLFLDERKAV